MRVVRGIKNALLNDVHELSAMLKTDQWHIRATYGNIRALQNDFGLTEPYPMQTISRNLPDEAATLAAGEAIGRLLGAQPSPTLQLHVDLIGNLGAGKTTLVRGVLRGLGYTGRVKSPTYPLLENYRVGDLNLAHFDLYRLETPEAFIEAGFDESFLGPGVRFVEWPAQAGRHLPKADWRLTLTDAPQGGRLISAEALNPAAAALLAHLTL